MSLLQRAAAIALSLAALPAAAQTLGNCPAGLDEIARCYRGGDVARACAAESARFGGGCHFETAYQPTPPKDL